MIRYSTLVFSLFLLALPHKVATAKDQLVIGITQFPSTFHPNIDSMLAKSYILAMTRRPFTVYDVNWKNICLLCTKLPTIENGLARNETTLDGKNGVAVTFTIHPDATWGDGTPVTTKDVIFTWKVGRNKKSGVGNVEFYRSLYKIVAKDDKTFTLHFDKLTFEYNSIGGFELLPAHLDEKNFADPLTYKNRTAFDTDTTNPGLYFGPFRIDEAIAGLHDMSEQVSLERVDSKDNTSDVLTKPMPLNCWVSRSVIQRIDSTSPKRPKSACSTGSPSCSGTLAT